VKWVFDPLFCYMDSNMLDVKQKLKNLIGPLCEQENFFLLDIHVYGKNNNYNLKFTVDTESGITLDQCKYLSKEISDLLFRKDIIPGNYRLEVSSPGVQKNLEHAFEFRRNIGRRLLVRYRDGNDIKEIVGELDSYDDDILTLKSNNDLVSVPLNLLEQAKIKLKW